VTVSDEEIAAAMRASYDHLGLVAEPSGATALAAVLSDRLALGQRIGVVVSGGNVDSETFERLVGLPMPAGETRATPARGPASRARRCAG
jgi:threonine dehydratase